MPYVRFKKPTKKIPGKGGQRWYKNVGLGFKTPKEAMEGMHFVSGSHNEQADKLEGSAISRVESSSSAVCRRTCQGCS